MAPRGPVVITSRSLSADNRTNTAVFEGDVVAKTGDVVLHADRMKVQYLPEGGGVSLIEAEGGVKLVRGDRVVTSGRATYYGDERKIIFTEEPRAVQDGNVITGSRMTYLIDEDRSIIEDSKVFLQEKG
ncbi:MAG: lipopolysaccharide transport periplasmic protein LptA [Thermodesulfovibrionales bacterium]